MAIFVVSDIHGHARAFDRALELAQPGSDDTVFVLGDMVDRGPDPLGVIDMVRALPNVRVLMGNHEEMLYESLESGDERDKLTWHMNGGYTTYEQLEQLPHDRYVDLMDWLVNLPTFAVVEVDDRRPSAARGDRRSYLLAHAGVDAPRLRASLDALGVSYSEAEGYAAATPDDLLAAMIEQDVNDLLWIRREFWSTPTGLVGTSGLGPVVVAGHTPSISMPRYASLMSAARVTPAASRIGSASIAPPQRAIPAAAWALCASKIAACGSPTSRRASKPRCEGPVLRRNGSMRGMGGGFSRIGPA